MSKTLVVSYYPRQEQSQTKKLADHFLSEVQQTSTELSTVDLLVDTPDLLLSEPLQAMIKSTFMNLPLTPAEQTSLAKINRMVDQFIESDVFVIGHPVYNFSLPATVKAYYDSVIQKGKTFDYAPDGKRIGLMKGKKALVMMTSLGEYSAEIGNLEWEHAASLSKILLTFMGFAEIEVVHVGGLSAEEAVVRDKMTAAKQHISGVVQEWYG